MVYSHKLFTISIVIYTLLAEMLIVTFPLKYSKTNVTKKGNNLNCQFLKTVLVYNT